MILRDQLRNFAALANNDLGVKRKFACHFGAYLHLGRWLPNHERACRANVDGTDVLQLFGQLGWSEVPVSPDVDPSQKNNECH
jgi:hypothetical protein